MTLGALMMGRPEPETQAARAPAKSQAAAVIDDVEELARVAADTAQWLFDAGLGQIAEPLASSVVRLADSLQAARRRD